MNKNTELVRTGQGEIVIRGGSRILEGGRGWCAHLRRKFTGSPIFIIMGCRIFCLMK